jgi:acyl-CoA synthetase (AMP-forming)/AMP-acid ligase II
LPLAPEVHRIRIADEAGNSLPPGNPGEIVKQSPVVMKGYFKNPEATAKALKDGWLYTGDLGYLDKDGYLYFVDRLKDMVRRGDENISSEEVERVLNSHPAVAESAVIAVPDQIRGEEVKAYIVLKPPATPEGVTPEEIWNFCKPHLAAFKVPRYLEYRAELPKTPSSKVQKNILRDESREPTAKVFDRLAHTNE